MEYPHLNHQYFYDRESYPNNIVPISAFGEEFDEVVNVNIKAPGGGFRDDPLGFGPVIQGVKTVARVIKNYSF